MNESLLFVMAGLILILCLATFSVIMRLQSAVARIDGRLNSLLVQSGIDVDAIANERVTELMRAGKKIEAIRIYRQMTGCGLAQAKQKVESLM